MTKYFEEQNKIERMRQQKADLPIAISGENLRDNKKAYYCNDCQYKMVKISDDEYHCNHCNNSAYPEVEQLRSKSKITTPIGMNLEPCLSYPKDPDADFFKDKNPEPKGTFKILKDMGIKITSYSEGVG